MKQFLLALFAFMSAVMLVAPAFATELWDPHLRGVDEGLAAGALPPQGVYFINNSYFMPDYHYNGNLPVPKVGSVVVSPGGHVNSDILRERLHR